MLQAANTDPLNPLVPKAHNSECQNGSKMFQKTKSPGRKDCNIIERVVAKHCDIYNVALQ